MLWPMKSGIQLHSPFIDPRTQNDNSSPNLSKPTIASSNIDLSNPPPSPKRRAVDVPV